MLPVMRSNSKFNKVVISTGNILNANKKPSPRSNEELVEALRLTLCSELSGVVELNDIDGEVLRASKELCERIMEHERSHISIGAKIFLNKTLNSGIVEAVDALLRILKVQQIDNVVLAYHPQPCTDSAPISPDNVFNGDSYGVLKWSSKNDESTADLMRLWQVLEVLSEQKKICQIGISDLDMDTLSDLYAASNVQPSIAQINLSSCCVVPPALQDFCNKHDIQLLTHSDPEVLLENEQLIITGYKVEWVLRYQVHVRCRGVLAAKGYIVGAVKCEPKHEG